jgi:thiaminase
MPVTKKKKVQKRKAVSSNKKEIKTVYSVHLLDTAKDAELARLNANLLKCENLLEMAKQEIIRQQVELYKLSGDLMMATQQKQKAVNELHSTLDSIPKWINSKWFIRLFRS